MSAFTKSINMDNHDTQTNFNIIDYEDKPIELTSEEDVCTCHKIDQSSPKSVHFLDQLGSVMPPYPRTSSSQLKREQNES